MEFKLDSDGNTYNFGFVLNWYEQIKDERYEEYPIKQLR